MTKVSRILAAVAALALGSTVALIGTPAAAQGVAPGAVTAVFAKTSEWPGGHVGSLTVRNGSDRAVTGWQVSFDLPAGTTITNVWGGTQTSTAGRHVITGSTWNGTVAAGASATVGWLAAGNGSPTGCTVNGSPCDGVPIDFQPPTAPTELGVDRTSGVVLRWQPSTDDTGDVSYEVFDGTSLLATVTEPTYVFSTTNTIPPKVYVFGVRAVDAFGNISPYAFHVLGPAFADVPPPAPSDLRVDGTDGLALRLTWAPGQQQPVAMAPPVAGYEVYVDGELATRVGTAQAILPVPAPGTYTIGVRAFNAIGRTADVLEVQYTVA